MTDYIARESVREVLLNPAVRGIGFTEYELDKIPIADVAPVRHGRWIEVKRYDGYGLRVMQECNVCACCENWLANYCPNCGAKMDLEVSE